MLAFVIQAGHEGETKISDRCSKGEETILGVYSRHPRYLWPREKRKESQRGYLPSALSLYRRLSCRWRYGAHFFGKGSRRGYLVNSRGLIDASGTSESPGCQTCLTDCISCAAGRSLKS